MSSGGGDEIERLILKHALANAYRHGGRPDPNAVLGKVLSERPDLRADARRIRTIVEEVCSSVASMGADEQRRALEEAAPELMEHRRGPQEGHGHGSLPPLPGAKEVVTRFAPNPDSVLHLGSARAAILSHDYARMYGGRFILRFDDTDPRTKRAKEDMYQAIREDLEWLGCRPDEEYVQSTRMEVYYRYIEELIGLGGAYVDTCSPEQFRSLVSRSMPCPERDLQPGEHLDRWRAMLSGGYGEGDAVVRVKTDLDHPNPAVRDWPAFRVIDTERDPHPVTGSKYRVWPLYNWASAVDDHLMGITHVFRGQEHSTNTVKQRYVYGYFGWEYPVTVHYGRLTIEGGVLSKSKIEQGIRSGSYGGYDDPRLATLRALRRRGILPDAVRAVIYAVGVRGSDAVVSWDNLLAANRKLLDPVAPRYFAVLDPVELQLTGLEGPIEVHMPKHPQNPALGERRYVLTPGPDGLRLLVERSDADGLSPGSIVRLMALANAEVMVREGEGEGGSGRLVARRSPGGVEEARRSGAPFIHWVDQSNSAPVVVVMPDASERRGYMEAAAASESPGTVVQFERMFFARLDSVGPGGAVFYYTSD